LRTLEQDVVTQLPARSAPSGSVPIYVDLDSTLMRSDLLYEALLSLARRAPLLLLLVPFWLLRGRACLESHLADAGVVDPAQLPYRAELVEYLTRKAAQGHRIVLVTASSERLVQPIAEHLGIFDTVIASTATQNLRGSRKTEAITCDAVGDFVYAGHDAADIAVWQRASAAIVVDATPSIVRRAEAATRVELSIPRGPFSILHYLRAMRVYQWSKNALVFVPLLTAHLWASVDAIISSVLAFLAFSLAASAAYLLNDLYDLPDDRHHPKKRTRALAAGLISIRNGLLLAPLLIAAALVVARLNSPTFVAVLAAYFIATCAYSFVFKSYVLIDVGVLSALYTLRVLAGAVAIGVVGTFWLLAFSVFLFLSLALIKRTSELILLARVNREGASGRNYLASDIPVLLSIGVGSGYAAVVVFALYINSETVASSYSRPQALWLLCGTILYWIARMWLKTARGEMHHDPLVYAARDRGSIIMLLLSVALVIIAV
jgi:4-hydroxybenzoate polyprenyltransferase